MADEFNKFRQGGEPVAQMTVQERKALSDKQWMNENMHPQRETFAYKATGYAPLVFGGFMVANTVKLGVQSQMDRQKRLAEEAKMAAMPETIKADNEIFKRDI